MTKRDQLWLSFYGDDLTGSTDALEQLSLAGVKTVLFLEPPTPAQLRSFPDLQACGVAGLSRSLAPDPLVKVLRPALLSLRALGARHVHYKICSTFDSSPTIGNLGCVLEVAAEIFPAKFVPLLVAAPGLGRYTLFGNHFARYGIGSAGEIHRLDRHPSIGRHPVTPMKEADLRMHLAGQSRRSVALFDILQLSLPLNECRASFDKTLATRPNVILFDALAAEHLPRIGGLIDGFGSAKKPLFSIGSSGIEAALCSHWKETGELSARRSSHRPVRAAKQVLISSGSCSPVTSAQITWALKNGFAEVALNAAALASSDTTEREQQRGIKRATALLQAGRSVVIHTTRRGSNEKIQKSLQGRTAEVLGTALGRILLGALRARPCRVCLAGGDTASFAARALNITAVSLIAPLTPGAPLCRAHAPEAPVNGLEMVLKGGQVGAENFFEMVRSGNKIL